MIGIVFIGDLYVCPYLKRYTFVLEEERKEYEVLFWNRCGDKLNLPNNFRYFNYPSKEEQPIRKKAIDFYKYRKWLVEQLRRGKYDKLILLSTLSGMIIPDKLLNFKGKYIFDIRDYSYERNSIFFLIEKYIIWHSGYTCISSPGFSSFLPKYPYSVMHNIDLGELRFRYSFRKKAYGSQLNLVWNGTMRYFSHQKCIIDRLANDSRFNLVFHGDGPEIGIYKQYAEEKNISNIVFTGRYNNLDKGNLLKDADILNNSYWTDNENEVLYALSNRYYDGLIYKIPQLVEAGTYKTQLCEKNGIGIGLNCNLSSFANTLYDWYFSRDAKTFESSCERLLKSVVKDNTEVEGRFRSFLSD